MSNTRQDLLGEIYMMSEGRHDLVDKRIDADRATVDKDKLIKKLVEALEQAGKWFGEYADSHEKKGDSEKCIRNVARQAYCLAALNAAKAAGF